MDDWFAADHAKKPSCVTIVTGAFAAGVLDAADAVAAAAAAKAGLPAFHALWPASFCASVKPSNVATGTDALYCWKVVGPFAVEAGTTGFDSNDGGKR